MKRLLSILLALLPAAVFAAVGPGGSGTGSSGSGSSSTNPGSAMTNLIWSNTYFVDTNGNDSTSIFGDASKPARTPGYAITNTPNSGNVFIRPGTYTITPRIVMSNGFGGINIYAKTNLTIQGYGAVIDIPGTNYGELLFLTNSDTVKIYGLTLKGWVLTNWATAPGNGGYTNDYIWGALSTWGGKDHVFQDMRVVDHGDQGINELGASAGYAFCTNVVVRNCFFDNIGNLRTNLGIPSDGTAVTGGIWWTVENNHMQNCLRGIEPYVNPSVTTYQGPYVARNNYIHNMQEVGILTGGSTNMVGMTISGNVIVNDLGYLFRGMAHNTEAAGITPQGRNIKVTGNYIEGKWKYGVHLPYAASSGALNDIYIEGNTFNTLSNALSTPTSRGINIYDTGNAAIMADRVWIRGNVFRNIGYRSIVLDGVRNVMIEQNYFDNPILAPCAHSYQPVIGVGIVVNVNSNIAIRNNYFHDAALAGYACVSYALSLGSATKAISFIDNTCIGFEQGTAAYGLIDSNIGRELNVRFTPFVSFPSFTTGSYTNRQWETDITLPLGTTRSNWLTLPFNGHEVTIRDGTSTITTNIVLRPQSGIINGGLTNMTTNFASVTLIGNGTNWNYKAVYP